MHGIVWRRVFQVEMGRNTRAVQHGENADDEQWEVHAGGFSGARVIDWLFVC